MLTSQGMRHGAHPPVMHLRMMNPHVRAAAMDWEASRRLVPSIPRQPGPGVTAQAAKSTVGTSSFGISGVNGHLMLAATQHAAVKDVTPARSARLTGCFA